MPKSSSLTNTTTPSPPPKNTTSSALIKMPTKKITAVSALAVPRTFALVMLGSSFACILNASAGPHYHEHPLEDLLLRVTGACSTVICCRATPLQKALLVRMVRKRRRAVTLAIGDGANDVSMIKEAHVGVGISGQEGMQAVLASDYSIGQFRFLGRLLLVHGRWSYFRLSKFFAYFFYKNFAFSMSHFFYAMLCGYTAESVFDPWLVSFYNLFYTSLPVMAMGFFDQDVSERTSMQQPALYLVTLRGKLFNLRTFLLVAVGGIATALIIVVGMFLIFHDDADLSDKQAFSDATQTQLVLAVTMVICWMTSYWTMWNVLMVLLSMVAFFGIGAIQYLDVLPTSSLLLSFASYRGVHFAVYTRLDYWLATLLILTVLFVPIVAYRWVCTTLMPSLVERVRQQPQLPWSMASAQYLDATLKRAPAAGEPVIAVVPTTAAISVVDNVVVNYAVPPHSTVSSKFRMSTTRGGAGTGAGAGGGVSSSHPHLPHSSTRQYQANNVRSSYAFSQDSGWAKILQQGLNMRNSMAPSAAADGLKKLFSNVTASPGRIVERIQENLRPLGALLTLPGSSTAATTATTTAVSVQQPSPSPLPTTAAVGRSSSNKSPTPNLLNKTNRIVEASNESLADRRSTGSSSKLRVAAVAATSDTTNKAVDNVVVEQFQLKK